MSRRHALYVLAHRHNVPLEKLGVDDSTLIEVGGLANSAASGKGQPTQPTSGDQSANQSNNVTPAQRFAARSFHPRVTASSRKAFTNGLRPEAVRKAFQSVNNRIKKLSHSGRDGFNLMGWAFSDKTPQLQMTALTSESQENEHNGLRFLAQGSMLGIRNPRAHDDEWPPDADTDAVLELLGLASYLHRCLDRCESYSA